MIARKSIRRACLVANVALDRADSHSALKCQRAKPARILAMMSLCALVFVSGCNHGKGDSPASAQAHKKAPFVTTAPVLSGAIVHAIQLNGTVEPYRFAKLASPAEGPVLNLRAREGDKIIAGKPLLAIGRRTGVTALIASLTEELQKEEDNLNRTRRLVERRALPGEQLDNALASFERAKARLASARESERDYQIRAPFSGIVSRLLVNEGDFVSPRAGLVEIYDPTTLVLRATVSERYAALLKMDMPAAVTLDAYPKQSFSGRISRLYPYLDDRTRTRTIEISINEKVDLLPGMFGRIRLVIAKVPDALTIPVKALLVTPRGSSVVFVARDGKAVQRKLTAGIEDNGRLQVLAGVKSGEQVIVLGNEKLKDGAPIRLLGAKENKAGPGAASGSGSGPGHKQPRKKRGGDR